MNLSLKQRRERAIEIIIHLRELFPSPKSTLNYSTDIEFLFAVMLSAQNTDKGVNKVTDQLFKKHKKLEDYLQADLAEFDKDIKSINYHSTKAKHILQSAKIIAEKHKGNVPDTIDELLELPGVGRKTANVILGNLHKKPVGIAVDTHVRRLAKLYGLTDQDNPEKIEKDLMQIVPKEDWTGFTHLLIEYGRNYCPARKHKHEECSIQNLVDKISSKQKFRK